jgi:hypothetical protein
MTTTDKQNTPKTDPVAPKNGASKEHVVPDPDKPIVMSREDVLELLLASEKQRRLQAEAQRVNLELNQAQAESQGLTKRLSAKYGVNLDGAQVAADGKVTLKE